MAVTTDAKTGLQKTEPATTPEPRPPIRPDYKWLRKSDGKQTWWQEVKLGWTGRGTSLYTSFGEVGNAAEFVAHKTEEMNRFLAEAKHKQSQLQHKMAERQAEVNKKLGEIEKEIMATNKAREAGTLTERQVQREARLYSEHEKIVAEMEKGPDPRMKRDIERFVKKFEEEMTEMQAQIDEVLKLEEQRLSAIQAKASQVAQTAATAATQATAAGQAQTAQQQTVKATQAAAVSDQAVQQMNAMNEKILALQHKLEQAKTQATALPQTKPTPAQVTQQRAVNAATDAIAEAPPATRPALVKAAAQQIQSQVPVPPVPPAPPPAEEEFYYDEEEPAPKPAIPTWGKILGAVAAGLALKSKM